MGETARCRPGTITCNGGPCQDALSDPKNCGKCGNVVCAFQLSIKPNFIDMPNNIDQLFSVHLEFAKMAPALIQFIMVHSVNPAVKGVLQIPIISASKAPTVRSSAVRTSLALNLLPALPIPIVLRAACVLLLHAVSQASALQSVVASLASVEWHLLSASSEGQTQRMQLVYLPLLDFNTNNRPMVGETDRNGRGARRCSKRDVITQDCFGCCISLRPQQMRSLNNSQEMTRGEK